MLIYLYLKEGILSKDKVQAHKLKSRLVRYVLQQGSIYKRLFTQPLLRGLTPNQGNHVLRESIRVFVEPNGSSVPCTPSSYAMLLLNQDEAKCTKSGKKVQKVPKVFQLQPSTRVATGPSGQSLAIHSMGELTSWVPYQGPQEKEVCSDCTGLLH